MPSKEERYLAKFDEIETLAGELLETPKDEATSEFEDLLIEGYLLGFAFAREMLGVEEDEQVKPFIRSFLDKSYQGETVGAKFSDYYNHKDIESLKRLMESEYHRVFNEGEFDYADVANDLLRYGSVGEPMEVSYRFSEPKASPKGVFKTWVTMGDEKVRLTHEFLDGVTVPLWERFYTYDNDSALYPGDFRLASNVVNCRCHITLSVKEMAEEESVIRA